MMMVGGSGAAVDHNGIYPNPNLHSLQQPLMDADNADSRKRPLETPEEEAGCTKRTNIGGKTPSLFMVKQGMVVGEWQPNIVSRERIHPVDGWKLESTCACSGQVVYGRSGGFSVLHIWRNDLKSPSRGGLMCVEKQKCGCCRHSHSHAEAKTEAFAQ